MNKLTKLTSSNKTNVIRSSVIHIYKYGQKKKSHISFFTKNSVKKIFKSNKFVLKKKSKVLTVITRAKQWTTRVDGSQRKFSENSAFLIKRKFFLPYSTKSIGPTCLELGRKKYLTCFKNVI